MKNRGDTASEDEAVSIQVGFVLNTGILTAFIAIVLVLVSGGFDDTSPQQELELVRDSVESKMVEADRLARTSDGFTAFFEPPTSDLQYRGEINGGTLTLTAVEGTTEVEGDLSELLPDRGVSGSVQFSQTDQNIVMEYESESSCSPTCPLELSVQRNATRSIDP